ncbi:MAG: acyl carrier protein [Mycobacterium sp.]
MGNPGEVAVKSYDEIEAMLAEQVADRTGTSANEIDRTRRFDKLGLDSADAVRLVGELEDFVGRPLSASLPYNYPTIEQLARCLANGDD